MLRALTIGLILAGPLPALAQQPGWAGTYAATDGSALEATLRAPQGDRYPIEIGTGDGEGRCTGAVGGEVALGAAGSGALQVPNDSFDPQSRIPWLRERYCRIEIAISGPRMTLREGLGCLGFHGAACGFSGSLERR
ncbi:hypothetical protein GXW78_25975 [Roseomonas terrae]|uniref:Alkaline proteinase inhibitor/ Outer membrane lipoprotein Omp19 domain-containing protein n=1 Tax=Neoroseomonas terrae TaxID=424799 RepID=A0ABS5EQ50_9PROT|nr:hypothetical protein [Neoroseomonas terrae]MBR0653131.1 hypothetical protein [Neoroseomonas terrae]